MELPFEKFVFVCLRDVFCISHLVAEDAEDAAAEQVSVGMGVGSRFRGHEVEDDVVLEDVEEDVVRGIQSQLDFDNSNLFSPPPSPPAWDRNRSDDEVSLGTH